jgi:hypothetical protein
VYFPVRRDVKTFDQVLFPMRRKGKDSVAQSPEDTLGDSDREVDMRREVSVDRAAVKGVGDYRDSGKPRRDPAPALAVWVWTITGFTGCTRR